MNNDILQINFRVTADEMARIEANAKEAGLSKAAFCRLVAMNSKVNIVNARKNDGN